MGNLETSRPSVDPYKLLPVFQNLITLCYKLGTKYLWIDSLCLIQNDPVDRDSEAGLMGVIYQHAFCNFNVMAATERSVGLSVDCELTFETDVVPALSGLARRFNKDLQDKYLTEAWKGDLFDSTIWLRHSNISDGFHWSPPSQAMTYRGRTHPIVTNTYIYINEYPAPHGRGP